MNCPNDQCFCDGSCYDNEAFNSAWESYDELCNDLGLSKNDTNFEYGTTGTEIDESNWTLNNRTIEV